MVSSEMVAPATDAGATALLIESAFGGLAVVCRLVRRSIAQSYNRNFRESGCSTEQQIFGTG